MLSLRLSAVAGFDWCWRRRKESRQWLDDAANPVAVKCRKN
jgi:hypothetical protein